MTIRRAGTPAHLGSCCAAAYSRSGPIRLNAALRAALPLRQITVTIGKIISPNLRAPADGPQR